MSASILTIEAYERLAKRALSAVGRDIEAEGPFMLRVAANECKQAHRLLAEGRILDELTPMERMYAKAFKDVRAVKVPTPDGNWEPGVAHDPKSENVEKVEADTPEPKPKKKEK